MLSFLDLIRQQPMISQIVRHITNIPIDRSKAYQWLTMIVNAAPLFATILCLWERIRTRFAYNQSKPQI